MLLIDSLHVNYLYKTSPFDRKKRKKKRISFYFVNAIYECYHLRLLLLKQKQLCYLPAHPPSPLRISHAFSFNLSRVEGANIYSRPISKSDLVFLDFKAKLLIRIILRSGHLNVLILAFTFRKLGHFSMTYVLSFCLKRKNDSFSIIYAV